MNSVKEYKSASYKTGKIRKDNEIVIREAAEQEFAEFGFKGASIMSIAKRANVPRPNIHYYFKNKQELYNAVLMDILALWNKAFTEFTAEDEPAEAIGNYIRLKLMYSRCYPTASKIFANEILQGAPHLNTYLNNDLRVLLAHKTAIIQGWIDAGKMDAIQPYYLIFFIWGATQHYADFGIQIKSALGKEELSEEDFEEITANLIQIITKGCGLVK
ncbi:MAG: TetR family transcriptional regulator C-terminal domain-containing protein [Colwellia sp.]|nr:TetR family transcriptional regulator C-terminal domain-containing protein [Colwellia sp.]